MTKTRLEHDLLGERDVSAEHYYGIQTLRAVENFDITGIPISHYPRWVHSLAYIILLRSLIGYLMNDTDINGEKSGQKQKFIRY